MMRGMAITPDAFARKMMKALRQAGVTETLRYDPQRFALVGQGEIFLASAHQQYQKSSLFRRGGVLRHFARAFAVAPSQVIPPRFDDARGNLVPVVRSGAYLDQGLLLGRTSSSTGAQGRAPARFVDLSSSLYYGFAYDTPTALALFGGDQLDEWGVSFEDAMKAARYNLSVRSREPLQQVMPGLFVGPWRDSNASGRLILTELLTRLPVRGELIAMAPGNDFLLVAGSDDEAALAAMVEAATEAVQRPKPSLPVMLRLDGVHWRPFILPESHPSAVRHAELCRGFVASDYAEQKRLLDALHARDGVDVFVANCGTARKEGGPLLTWCSWADCVSLLPRTDLIVFQEPGPADEKRASVIVPWDAAAEVIGDRLVQVPELKLERYRVEGSPSPDELAELRERAEAP
jgi:hypothetical protein